MSAPADAFDPEQLHALGGEVLSLLRDHLAAMDRGEPPVLPADEPRAILARYAARLPPEEAGAPFEPGGLPSLLRQVLADSNHLHHPGYVGHQVTMPLPLAALCELFGALLNNGMAVYEMGPAATAMERALLRWLAARLGLPAGADGLLTSGGSAGNLTALLAARQARAGFDAWGAGQAAGPPLCVLASEAVHYCVGRAAQIMGWGQGGVQPVPTDERFRMRPEALPAALRAARAAGRRPVAVVAAACTTATGSFDPLGPIADFCAREGLWLHVDGAHGAAAALAPRYRHLVAGIERADSVVWDAHKLLHMPALCTAVLFRRGRDALGAFAQDASYLFHGEEGEGEAPLDHGLRTLECTKRMMSLPLYATLALGGGPLLAGCVSHGFDLARRFAALLRDAPDFRLAVEPEANIVCFRHEPAGEGDAERLDALQERARRQVLARGRFYLVQTRLRGRLYLRTALMNPRTTGADLAALLDEIRAAAR